MGRTKKSGNELNIANLYEIQLEYPYSHTIILRRSDFNTNDWEKLVERFKIYQVAPSKIVSITIDGEDDYGRLRVSIVAER